MNSPKMTSTALHAYCHVRLANDQRSGMLARLFTKRVIVAVIAVFAFGAAMATGAPSASAITNEDQHFIDFVEQLNIPTNSPEETIQVGREICNTVAAGQVEPARTLRGMVSTLTGKGLEKGQAVQLIRAAVGTYCPQYTAIVGR
jgi:hypothetical protein